MRRPEQYPIIKLVSCMLSQGGMLLKRNAKKFADDNDTHTYS